MTEKRPSELGPWLKRQMEQHGLGLRAAERKTEVSKGSLQNILDDPDVVPGLDTLAKLGTAFGVPLPRMVEMCGYEMAPSKTAANRAARLARQVEIDPELAPLADELVEVHPDDVDSVLTYLEFLRKRRESQPAGSRPA